MQYFSVIRPLTFHFGFVCYTLNKSVIFDIRKEERKVFRAVKIQHRETNNHNVIEKIPLFQALAPCLCIQEKSMWILFL